MVYRKNVKTCFTKISNELINNTGLSLKATMLSKPEDWHFTFDGIVAMCKEGKTAVRNALDELVTAGYVHLKESRDETGHFAYEYDVHEEPTAEPIVEEPAKDKPQVKKQSTEKPNTKKTNIDKQGTIYYYKINNKYNNIYI